MFLVGLSFGLPHILMSKLLGGYGKYTPLVVSNVSGQTWDETFGLAPRYREVYDGRLFIGDVNTYEYKSKPSPVPIFPALLLGLFARALGSVKNLFVWSDFISPAIIFILAYLFLFKVIKNRLVALMGSLALIYGHRLIVGFPPVSPWRIKYLTDSIFNFNNGVGMLEFARLDAPQFIYILNICAFYFLFLALQKGKSKFAVLSGIFFGLLFYSYLYYWLFFAAGCGILLCIYLIKMERPKTKILFVVLITGFLISIPYWINLAKFKLLPGAKDYLFTEYGRDPYLPLTYIAWLILFIIFYRKRDDIFYFFISFLLAGILCMNIQLVTGVNVLKSHWELRVLTPWLIFILTVMLNHLITGAFRTKFFQVLSGLLKKPISHCVYP